MTIFVIARVTILFYYLSLTAFGGVLDTYVDSTRATSKLPSGFFNGENYMKEIPLNTIQKTSPNYRKYSALVDDEDYERVSKYNWSITSKRGNIYAASWCNGKPTKMHIFIMGFKGADHKDGNGLNNQKSNLRKATQSQNSMNSRVIRNCSSRYKGVAWNSGVSKWVTQITLNKKNIHIGCFVSETDAAKAYNKKAKELFGEFANLNKLK